MHQENNDLRFQRLHFIQSSLFSVTLFLSAVLLFSIQPMLAKRFLPVYGGSPGVWTVCMLFFQALLLVGYAYAWLIGKVAKKNTIKKCILGVKFARFLHFSLLTLLFIDLLVVPIEFNPTPIAGFAPEQSILVNLVQQVGLFILVLASSSPLLQWIYSQTKGKSADDPYFLFVASNAGSLLALLSYPFWVERYFGLHEQFHYWTLGYFIYLGLVALLMVLSMRTSLVVIQHRERVFIDTPSWSNRMLWMCYGFIPCSLMLGMTFYISTDIAATPMLWILPLTVYLLSFMLVFVKKPLISQDYLLRNSLFFMIFIMICFIFGANSFPIMELLIIHLTFLGIVCFIYHGELYRLRPPVSQLSSFYCYMAIGGSAAGIFNGVIAPHLFTGAYEYPLVLLFAMIMLPKCGQREFFNWTPFWIAGLLFIHYCLPSSMELNWPIWTWLKIHHVFEVLGLLVLVIWPGNKLSMGLSLGLLLGFSVLGSSLQDGKLLVQQRDFYGIKQVIKLVDAHALLSHTTIHGFQLQGESRKTNSQLAYYALPLKVVQQLQKQHPQLRATIIGLGTGTMACQFRGIDSLEMIEIDPQVVNIAQNPHYFTFLHDCAPKAKLIVGDGRQIVKKLPDASRDLLVLDAFNSDAVPIHLLTQEAIALFAKKLTTDGVMLINVSNRHINLLPVLIASAQQLEKIILYKADQGAARLGQFASTWVMLTENKTFASQMMQLGWHFAANSEALLWTDDYSNVLPLLKWRHSQLMP